MENDPHMESIAQVLEEEEPSFKLSDDKAIKLLIKTMAKDKPRHERRALFRKFKKDLKG